MKKEIERYEKACDACVGAAFIHYILPKLKKAALKLGVTAIEEMNNYYFFKIGNKYVIEREFQELGKEYDKFFNDYIIPIHGSRYLYPHNFKFVM
jgi:hypothetical protein